MTTIHTIEAAYHPKDKMGFLIDWLLTLKCNYDCAYCPIGPSGHDNSTQHPPYEKCIEMLKQMYQYTDTIMQYKKHSFKDAILNVYGGEALYHPDIEKILIATTTEYENYSNRWRLRRRITTNATATEKLWKRVCNHIEGITFSYHSQGSEKMKTLFKKNIDHAVKIQKEYDIIVCMFPREEYWQDCLDFLKYCNQNNLNARPKMLDGSLGVYSEQQLEQLMPYIKNFDEIDAKKINSNDKIENQTRGCCGGRSMCINRSIKEHTTLIPRDIGFLGWHCSANQFFLHGNNVNGLYYTNKDCRVKLDGTVSPLATVDTMNDYINKMKESGLQTLICAQTMCRCGTCAPKSIHKKNLEDIMKIYNN
jgi:MoaA/NifB/PqqE/SkfB family radical SAM enzyme